VKISASKLIANRRNALKSIGPRAADGKLASSQNAQLHGLSKQAPELDIIDPCTEALLNEACALGFSAEDAKHLALTLIRGREVITAKHSAYEPVMEDEPRPLKHPVDTLGQATVEEALETGITMEELWEYANPPEPTYAELGLPEPDPVAERIEAHRKLMRYEQRAVNQIRKAARIKK
jgi:hypothetical protein